MKRTIVFIALALAIPAGISRFAAADWQGLLHDDPVIGYRSAGSNDAVAELQRRIDSGEVSLEFNERNGYLESVLRHLKIPVSSQGLVFSKTSFQLHRISPSNPRALYFADEIYVGWVRGGDMLELAAVDPNLGGVFYMLEQRKAEQPRFFRNDECLQCHSAGATGNVPGFMVRSVYPDERGYPIAPLGSHITNYSSPIRQRWGGWYVTGQHGSERHAGNMIFDEKSDPDRPEQLTGSNLSKLEGRFDPAGYPSVESDIVALMVLEHQTQMHNLITRLNYETRLALNNDKVMREALNEPERGMSESTRRRIGNAAESLVRHLMFIGETRWKTPISGTSGFTAEFAAGGRRDARGRSLRDLDLKQKLFRYPCSYLIYSPAFDALPQPALEEVYRRLRLALIGQSGDKDFAAVPEEDRKAVLEILRETKPGLPSNF
ncbi:MAG: hypothetical protein AB7H86_11825 [Blastocatellales bacterium]